jgi:hypothetical protein
MSEILQDGHSTIISFANDPAVKFKEVGVTPPGISGGGANDFTNMRNVTWRTKAPKKLKSMDDMSGEVQYDPAVYDSGSGANGVVDMINVNQLITVTFPDGDTVAFWGWLDNFAPNQAQEGEPPTANITVICSNINGSGVETAPVHTAAS